MSFVKTLATLAVGFAAAKGVERFNKMGGLDGMKDALGKAGEPGGMGDQMGEWAERMGMPGGKETVRGLFGQFGSQAASATAATEAGLGALIGAMTGAAKTGAGNISEMLGAVTSGTPVNAMMEDQAKLMIRAMIQASKADGEIDDTERQTILDHLSDASDEEIAFVKSELDGPIDITALANATSDHMKSQVYSSALLPITVDTEAEKQYLANLAAALGLETEKVAQIHETMGKPLI
ncbi:tellurite resistance TerB family protein [Thioclava sp. F36-6]|uniref:tellurite resistance TerB family protein n=1 Tax=Thioclava sp. F36-6 TaxID=1915316 RepID=UPI0009983F74|nr:tellurite resistance TerB family protein [Thioclava sp. F36-6]OOY31755.1 protein YebE [Thioclava sp. F36-6]